MSSNTLSSSCDNCKTLLQGAFCHQCGQEKTVILCSLKHLFQDLFSAFGSWDSRLWRTLIPLWFKPGVLTQQYISGHRAPYAPPLRLYLFSSIIAFLIFSLLTSDLPEQSKEQLSVEERQLISQQIQTELQQALEQSGVPYEPEKYDTLPFSGFLAEETKQALSKKLAFLGEHPAILISKFFSLAPQILLLLLPLLAGVLMLLYAFSGRFYIEHLILALHTHSFILHMLLFYIGLHFFAIPVATIPWLLAPINWLQTLVLLWIPVYLLMTQKVFYQQNWGKTIVKFWLTSGCYMLLMSTALMMLLLLSIWWA